LPSLIDYFIMTCVLWLCGYYVVIILALVHCTSLLL